MIRAAKKYLAELEQQSAGQALQGDLFAIPLPLSEPEVIEDPALPLLDRLSEIDPDEVSPRAALALLYELKALSGK